MSAMKVIDIKDLTHDEKDGLDFLLQKNIDEQNSSMTHYLLNPCDFLQYPKGYFDDDLEEESLLEPQNSEDYWLAPEDIIERLRGLDIIEILRDLSDRRPFVTLLTFHEEIANQYSKKIGWETELVKEYLNRFFSRINPNDKIDISYNDNVSVDDIINARPNEYLLRVSTKFDQKTIEVDN
jgi:hypothetical protein